MKKTKLRFKQKFKRLRLFFFIWELIWVFVFSIVFFSTQPATPKHTDVINSEIIEINTNYLQNNGYTVYIETPEKSYRINWVSYNENYSERNPDNALKGLKNESSVAITYLKNSEKTTFGGTKVFEIVDIRTEKTIYYNIDDYNKLQKENRIFGFVTLGLFWFLFTSVFVFIINLNRPKRRKRGKTGDGSMSRSK